MSLFSLLTLLITHPVAIHSRRYSRQFLVTTFIISFFASPLTFLGQLQSRQWCSKL